MKQYRPTAFDVEQENIDRVITIIESKKTTTVRQLRHVMQLTPYLFDNILKIIRDDYRDIISWNKKARQFTRVKQIEVIKE